MKLAFGFLFYGEVTQRTTEPFRGIFSVVLLIFSVALCVTSFLKTIFTLV